MNINKITFYLDILIPFFNACELFIELLFWNSSHKNENLPNPQAIQDEFLHQNRFGEI